LHSSVVIQSKGEKVEIEVESAKGTRCLELSHAIEEMLGEDSQLLKKE